jgi:hypothetical protein
MAYIRIGELSLQETVGSQIIVGENGVASGTVEYVASGDQASAAMGMESHPNYSFLKRKSIRVVNEEGGMVRISATFEGIPPQPNTEAGGAAGGAGSSGTSVPKYSVKSSTNSEPIQSHINFDKFTNPDETGIEFVQTGQGKDSFYGFTKKGNYTQKLFYGVKSYLCPSIILQETVLYESKSSVRADLGLSLIHI